MTVRPHDLRRPARLVLAALVLGGAALGLGACRARAPVSAQRGLSDWLDDCSPFGSYDGGRKLSLAYDGTVELDAGAAPNTKGRWTGEEAGRNLTLEIAGAPAVRYNLDLPAGARTCILTPSAPPVIDLRTAWFGSIKKPDDDDDP